ncbi:HET-domain-containing protein, partial [Canariomyces notabilis]
MTSRISRLARRIRGRNGDARDLLFNTCAVCKNLCLASKLLNEVDFCSLVRRTGEEALGDPYRSETVHRDKLPEYFVDRINDCNQWNEFETYVFEHAEFPHHLSAAALKQSARDKCHLCSLLWSHFSTVRYGILEQEVDVDVVRKMEESQQAAISLVRATVEPLFVRVGIKIGFEGGYIAIVLYTGHQEERLPEVRSALNVWMTKGVSGVTKVPLEAMKGDLPADCNSLFQTSTASEHTIHLIKEWMKCCQGKEHFLCKLENEGLNDLPKRLLDVSHKKPRLYLPSIRDKGNLKYLCLSHCWGKGGVFKLTAATLPILQSGIEFSQLPKTFQDAVDITRRLNYSYIWIDSLCIQQDSADDWVDQAAKMTSIYMNADLTLAALASKDSTGGMYSHDRNMQNCWPCILPTKLPLTAWNGRIWPFHNERLTTAPLLSRGWVLQERCLGPRIVYFGKFGVYWECATMRADEVFTAGFASDGAGFPLYIRITDVDPFPHHIFAKFLGYWYEIVERYTGVHLTFGRDKLVAINGIVQIIQKRTGLTPFAGLWLEYLLDDMLWKTVRPELISRPTEYQAPSFSWASLNGPV